MKITGIIAEYNPFHNGHAYQIEKIKKETNADYVIVAMSGDFVQRGTPAIVDKYARTKMALANGADLVFELPTVLATASAELFAMGGVTLLDKTNCVSTLCFGAETADGELFSAIANLLVAEPDSYRTSLKAYIKDGLSFPVARSRAILDYATAHPDFFPETSSGNTPFQDATESLEQSLFQQITDVCQKPNNILAIEYQKALTKRNSPMNCAILSREGSGYHDKKLSSMSSATAIRSAILSGQDFSHAMPEPAYAILMETLSKRSPVCANDFSMLLRYLLLTHAKEGFQTYGDCSEFLSNRILKTADSFEDISSFCEQLKTKEITYTRISRILNHILLGITKEDYQRVASLDFIPYLRILGFRKESSALLSEIKKNADIPLISKPADAASLLSKDAYMLFEKDVFAASLYESVSAQKAHTKIRNEFRREIVLL